MLKKITLIVAAAALLAFASTLIGTSTTSAHERRAVADGAYGMIVGFQNEPAYLNEPNGLSVRVYTVEDGVELLEATSEERIGVEGLEETLQAEVTQGGAEPLALELEAAFGDPGAYNGNFLPTAMGDYSYRIFGEIEGTEIDETFTSGPETFSAIDEPVQYPVQVLTNQELEASLGSGGEADDDEDSNTVPIVVGIIGIVLGAAGLGAGGMALTRGRA